jgi:hypothetical protein
VHNAVKVSDPTESHAHPKFQFDLLTIAFQPFDEGPPAALAVIAGSKRE